MPGAFAPSAVALYSSSETVTCVAPAHAQGLVRLGLKVNGMMVPVESSSDSSADVVLSGTTVVSGTTLPFTYLGSPMVQGIYPQMGVVGGGDIVTVNGQGWLSLIHNDQMVPTVANPNQ